MVICKRSALTVNILAYSTNVLVYTTLFGLYLKRSKHFGKYFQYLETWQLTFVEIYLVSQVSQVLTISLGSIGNHRKHCLNYETFSLTSFKYQTGMVIL